MSAKMAIMSATTKEYLQIVTNSQVDGRNTYRWIPIARHMEAKMAILSATTKEYLHIVGFITFLGNGSTTAL